MMPMRLGAIALLTAVAVPAAAAAPRTHVVVIDKMKFGAMPPSVRAGDRIMWVNKDFVPHTATSKQAAFDANLPASTKAVTVVRKAGAFRVVCRFHPGMVATLNVKG
jgi:plastocyanin